MLTKRKRSFERAVERLWDEWFNGDHEWRFPAVMETLRAALTASRIPRDERLAEMQPFVNIIEAERDRAERLAEQIKPAP